MTLVGFKAKNQVGKRGALDKPTLDEFVAVLAAVEMYAKKMRPRVRRTTKDMPRLLAELRESVERVEAVSHD